MCTVWSSKFSLNLTVQYGDDLEQSSVEDVTKDLFKEYISGLFGPDETTVLFIP